MIASTRWMKEILLPINGARIGTWKILLCEIGSRYQVETQVHVFCGVLPRFCKAWNARIEFTLRVWKCQYPWPDDSWNGPFVWTTRIGISSQYVEVLHFHWVHQLGICEIKPAVVVLLNWSEWEKAYVNWFEFELGSIKTEWPKCGGSRTWRLPG